MPSRACNAWPGYFTVAVFLPVRSEEEALWHGKSSLYQAKTPNAHRIPLLGALGVATVKYPG
jgi:hypothetical protein